jgi:hypothetical protein
MTMTNLHLRGGGVGVVVVDDGGGSLPSNKQRKNLSIPSATLSSSLLPLSLSSSSPTSSDCSSSSPSSSARLHNYNQKYYSNNNNNNNNNSNINRNYKRRPSWSLCRRVPIFVRMIYLGIGFVLVRSYVSIQDNEETTHRIQLIQRQQHQQQQYQYQSPLLKLTKLTAENKNNNNYDYNGEQNSVEDEDEKIDWFPGVQRFEKEVGVMYDKPYEPSDFVQHLHQLRDELLEIASSSTTAATMNTTSSKSQQQQQQQLLKPPPDQPIDFQYPILLPPKIGITDNSTLVILVPSHQGSFVKRQAIRETWMAAAISHNVSATILFVVGQSECEEFESDFTSDDIDNDSSDYDNDIDIDNDVNGFYDNNNDNNDNTDQHEENNYDGQDLTGEHTEGQRRLRRRRLMQESSGKQSFENKNITSVVSRNVTETKTEAKTNTATKQSSRNVTKSKTEAKAKEKSNTTTEQSSRSVTKTEAKANTTTKQSFENNITSSESRNVTETETETKAKAKAKANTTTEQSFENDITSVVSRNAIETKTEAKTTTNTYSNNNDSSTSTNISSSTNANSSTSTNTNTSSSNASNSNETATIIPLTCDQIDHNFLRLEQERYQDLLEIPMKEHYNRLPEKMVQAYNWVLNNNIGLFPNVKWIAKVDDDMFVNVQNLEQYLRKYNSDIPMIIGEIVYHSPVAKEGKWREDDYDKSFYPYWPKGSAGHVLSRAAAKYITETSESLHRYQGEDVSIGIWFDTARKSGQLQDVTYIHAKKMFSSSGKDYCDWNAHAVIVGHELSPDEQLECQKKQFNKNDDGEEEIYSEAAWLDIPSDFEEMIRQEESSFGYEKGGRVSI